MTDKQRQLLTELFDDLEVVHKHLTRSRSILARLSRSLNRVQLMAVLKASVRPLIQINALEGLIDKPLLSS